MRIDKKYQFGNIVFRIKSPLLFKEDKRFEAFAVKDSVREDYTYEICQMESGEKKDQGQSVRLERSGDYFKVYIRALLVPKINIANLFSAAGTPGLLPEKDEFILHSSYVLYQNRALLFCAPSGTGKSTQAELWRTVRNTVTVNEDRVIIFKKENEYYAGGCWATGKSRTCLNISAPIHRIILLEQGKTNSISNPSSAEKFAKIISQCSFDGKNEDQREKMIFNIIDLVEKVPISSYACVNGADAVEELEKYL